MSRAQLSARESATVEPKVIPRISTQSLKGMSRGKVGSAHPAIANALEFRGLSLAPVAYSYVLMACRILGKAVGSVTKNDISSAYAMTVVFRFRRPTCMPGMNSSRDRKRGCRHMAYRHILSGHPCRTPLRMATVTTRVPFICIDAWIWSYMACSLSTNHWLFNTVAALGTGSRVICDQMSVGSPVIAGRVVFVWFHGRP